jgi:pimeloyl-ACP methyl ester carboxylesterase
MTTFCLVHGAFGGGWCWSRVIPELEQRGIRCIAPDLPSEDTTAGASRYADVVVDALKEVDEVVVLVGHSMGGLTIPIVARRRPVSHLVFVCAVLPTPGASHLDESTARNQRDNRHVVQETDGTLRWEVEAAIDFCYQDCSREDAVWAASQRRRQALLPVIEPSPLDRWPDVECDYIVCGEDRMIDPSSSRRWSLERFGKAAIELPGGHSPMISRPTELVDALLAVTALTT